MTLFEVLLLVALGIIGLGVVACALLLLRRIRQADKQHGEVQLSHEATQRAAADLIMAAQRALSWQEDPRREIEQPPQTYALPAGLIAHYQQHPIISGGPASQLIGDPDLEHTSPPAIVTGYTDDPLGEEPPQDVEPPDYGQAPELPVDAVTTDATELSQFWAASPALPAADPLGVPALPFSASTLVANIQGADVQAIGDGLFGTPGGQPATAIPAVVAPAANPPQPSAPDGLVDTGEVRWSGEGGDQPQPERVQHSAPANGVDDPEGVMNDNSLFAQVRAEVTGRFNIQEELAAAKQQA